MRSGHLGLHRAWLAWALVCVLGHIAPAHAQTPVLCTGACDGALFARIRGQTRDLPIRLINAPREGLRQPSAERLQEFAAEHAARFVVAIERAPSGARAVYVYDTRSRDLRVRGAPPPARRDRFGRSAASETVALIVRGELSDALKARASDVQRGSAPTETTSSTASQPGTGPRDASTERAGEAATVSNDARQAPQRTGQSSDTHPAATATPAQPSGTRPSPRQSPSRERQSADTDGLPQTASDTTSASAWLQPVGVTFELAARLSTPNEQRYFVGPNLCARLFMGALSLGMSGSVSMESRSVVRGLELSLREYTLGLEALAHLQLTRTLRGGLGIAGRWLFYRRQTAATAGASDWALEPARIATSLAVGPLLDLRWQLAQHLGMTLRIGLDIVLRPLSLRVRSQQNGNLLQELERMRRLEPWITLGASYAL